MATTTTVQLGGYAPLTDSFSLQLDINDRATYFVDEIKTPQPKKQTVEVWNIRTVGTRYVKQQHQQREITVTLYVQSATVPALLTALQNLQSQVEGMSVGVNPANGTTPPVLKLQAPNATAARYSLVLKTEHTIDYAVKELISNPAKLGGKKRISLIFSCWPFAFSIPRQWLANGVSNPGFEAPSGPAVLAFFDNFASANAYTTLVGTPPNFGSNALNVPNGTTIQFGSPAWGAINQWQVRFQAATGMTAQFYPHRTDASNFCDIIIQLSSWSLNQEVAGTNHQLATASITLTNGTFYWLVFTQFPSVSGNAPQIQAFLYNDSSGSIGSQITNGALGPVATFDAVTALVGKPAISASGAALLLGGNFPSVHTLSLFGPGGWLFVGTNGSGVCSGAWDGSRSEYGMSGNGGANTYPNGPVTSFGAARIDCPPAGTVNAVWETWGGGTPAGSSAIPVQTAGNVIQVSCWAKQAGLSGTATVALQITQWDVNGNVLGSTVGLLSKTAAQMGSGWTQFTGSQTTVANTAYVSVAVNVVDTSAGASAGATVWLDNVQVWDQTRTGMASMPYCELRFPQSPAQLLVSGLLGDAPAPCLLSLGTFQSNWPGAGILTFRVGRRNGAGAGMQYMSVGSDMASWTNGTCALDSTSYGGFYLWNNGVKLEPWALINKMSDAQGMYHLFARIWTSVPGGNLNTNVLSVNKEAFERQTGAFGLPFSPWQSWIPGANIVPFTQSSTWTIGDQGQVAIPAAQRGGTTDLTQLYSAVTVAYVDTNAPGDSTTVRMNWFLLLPVDGVVINGTINNQNGAQSVANAEVFAYIDAMTAAQTGGGISAETTPIPNPAHASGVPGNLGWSINQTADTVFTLDPNIQIGGLSVNQLPGFFTDASGSVLPILAEIAYSPRYLWPL